MTSITSLLGRPGLFGGASPVDKLDMAGKSSSKSVKKCSGNKDTAVGQLGRRPAMGLTENKSPTFLSSGNPCLDFFFHVVPDTPPGDLNKRLQLAWAFNPLMTVKLICNLRGVRGTGKSDKEGFYTAVLWLHDHHPKTLACNAGVFANFGCFKDLLDILYRILAGTEVRIILKEERHDPRRGKNCWQRRESRSELEFLKNNKVLENKVLARRSLHRYSSDLKYGFLHDRISDLFAEYLKLDIQHLNSGELYKISLASKWCPRLNSSYDRSTMICESIARKVFPCSEYPEYQGIDEAQYVYRVRDRWRKQVLVPLDKALELQELLMSSNKWESLPYNWVASVAMTEAGALLPHEIISSLYKKDSNEEVAERQWARMVEDLSKNGKLTNCIAICDVSGSMEGKPKEVCVALGLLVSELSEDPWKGKVITFSETPQLHKIEGDSLESKSDFVRTMKCGMNTDFQKVFDRILEVAVEGNLSEDKMIKRVFVFSDMEFGEASERYGCHRYDYDGKRGKASRKWESDSDFSSQWDSSSKSVSSSESESPDSYSGCRRKKASCKRTNRTSVKRRKKASYDLDSQSVSLSISGSTSSESSYSLPCRRKKKSCHERRKKSSHELDSPSSESSYSLPCKRRKKSSHERRKKASRELDSPSYSLPCKRRKKYLSHERRKKASYELDSPSMSLSISESTSSESSYSLPCRRKKKSSHERRKKKSSHERRKKASYDLDSRSVSPSISESTSWESSYSLPCKRRKKSSHERRKKASHNSSSGSESESSHCFSSSKSSKRTSQFQKWETDYEVIQRKFLKKGYSRVPEIVFWNLGNSSATPVTAMENGVALVSGFSKNLLTLFLDGGGIVNPEAVMESAISGQEYQELVIFD